MSENFGSLEQLGTASNGQEQAAESYEKFRETYQQSQTAIKQMQKDESKKKQDDTTLADIIVRLLGDSGYTKFFLLICRLVAKNIPSDLILAVIALIYEPARKAIAREFTGQLILETPKSTNLSDYTGNEKIDSWIEKIFLVASAEPGRIAETAFHEEKTADPELVEFSVMVLREFLRKSRGDEPRFKSPEKLCAAFWKKLITQLKIHFEYHKLFRKRGGVEV